ncbi:MAG: DUF3465 domain-containing protein [Chloroflexota bacterium]|nr:DUF3465 domain-containing protein [Chloroflexota bacterium]
MSRPTQIWLGIALLAAVGGLEIIRLSRHQTSLAEARDASRVGCASVAAAYHDHRAFLWLTVAARVAHVLPDSFGRYQHQRFLMRCPTGQHILIVNDVTVGQRVPIKPGDRVAAHGEYIWNRQGGLIHFTHSSAGGEQGWILRGDHIYS